MSIRRKWAETSPRAFPPSGHFPSRFRPSASSLRYVPEMQRRDSATRGIRNTREVRNKRWKSEILPRQLASRKLKPNSRAFFHRHRAVAIPYHFLIRFLLFSRCFSLLLFVPLASEPRSRKMTHRQNSSSSYISILDEQTKQHLAMGKLLLNISK